MWDHGTVVQESEEDSIEVVGLLVAPGPSPG